MLLMSSDALQTTVINPLQKYHINADIQWIKKKQCEMIIIRQIYLKINKLCQRN